MALYFVFAECKIGWHDECRETFISPFDQNLSECTCNCHADWKAWKHYDNPENRKSTDSAPRKLKRDE